LEGHQPANQQGGTLTTRVQIPATAPIPVQQNFGYSFLTQKKILNKGLLLLVAVS
jgi:hypothetical protein